MEKNSNDKSKKFTIVFKSVRKNKQKSCVGHGTLAEAILPRKKKNFSAIHNVYLLIIKYYNIFT